MKKWVFGCLGLFIIVAVGGGYAAYRFLYLPGKAYVQSFAQLKVVPELQAQISNQTPFDPPAGDALTTASVQRFVRAQQAVHTRLGERITEIETKYEALRPANSQGQVKLSFGEAMNVLKDFTGLFIDAKKAQVEALNAGGLSLAEYEWTRARVYEALGVPIDTTLQQIIRDATAGKVPDIKSITDAPSVQVPEKNREIVKPFTKELTRSVALAFFAL